MKRDGLHDGRRDGLVPLEPLDVGQVESFSGLLRAMARTAFGGRQLGRALEVALAMIRDPDCRVVLTISGAMTVAKQGKIICEMIERGMVQAVVATGALIAHGLTEAIGLVHYEHDPEQSDRELFARGYNRVYDTLEMESNLHGVERVVRAVLDAETPPDGVWSSARLCRALGRRLAEQDQGRAILRSAYERDVPVFIPAFTDSEMGLDLSVWSMRCLIAASDPTKPPLSVERLLEAIPQFNPFLDLQQYARLAAGAERMGIFTVGGGVPRNWAQQVAPYFEVICDRLDLDWQIPRFHYGVRICPEPVHWGGLSGCTYSEGVSWGKFTSPTEGGQFAEVYADATLVWPLLIKAVLEEMDASGSVPPVTS